MADMTAPAARDEPRLGREKRREMALGSGERSARPSAPGASPSEAAEASGESMPAHLREISPGATALVGGAVGLLAGVLVGRGTRKGGNEIVGDVALHLLNKIELLTIRLQVRQARRGGPTEIDVHHVRADAKSRP